MLSSAAWNSGKVMLPTATTKGEHTPTEEAQRPTPSGEAAQAHTTGAHTRSERGPANCAPLLRHHSKLSRVWLRCAHQLAEIELVREANVRLQNVLQLAEGQPGVLFLVRSHAIAGHHDVVPPQ